MNEQEQPQLKRSNALLAGRYHVISMVSKGAFGAVYKAEDVQRNDALVAIKEINLGGLSSQEVVEATDAFNRKVRLLSGLEHPNLPHIYDHFTDAEHWYLVMDFIEGETLEAYLDRTPGKQLLVDDVLDIGMQLCTVLHYLHTHQPPIIFRDVKPANIMRTPTGHLYLIDFGIARHFTPGQARDTSALGSPGYAAPEQYGRAQTTVQSDIYSLGAILRYLLTGKDPLEPTFGYASPYAEEVPAELELLLVQMLDPDASKRPASMDAVKRTLQRIKDESLPKVPATQQLAHSPGYAVVTTQQTATPVGTTGQTLQPPTTPAAPRGISRRTVIVGLAGLVGLAVVGGGIVLFRSLPDPHLLYTYRGHSTYVDAVAWSPDGKRIASGGGDDTAQVWDASTGRKVLTYTGYAGAVAWSPDGKRIASGSWDNTVQVWDAADGGHVYTYRGHPYAQYQNGTVTAVAWSPDGRRIASGGRSPDNTVQVWDAADGGHVYTYRGHTNWVNAVAWSPDGKRIASVGCDPTVQVRDAADGGHVYTYRGHSSAVRSVAWSPDGRRIASGGSWDNTVQVWEAADGGHVYTYRGHSQHVFAVAWSPDGKRIASASLDKTVQVWEAP